ncbi:MAG TPA: methionine--tRNA ligase subunit beta, partial [Terriglobales bacterium]|nr:methionine--tRNA ligase subunit beta [Terriglobales bacterium]
KTRTAADEQIAQTAGEVIRSYRELFEDYQFSKALEAAWTVVAAVNKYLVENEPWTLAEKTDEDSRARLATVLYTAAEALRVVTALVHPVMPEATGRIWSQLGLGAVAKARLDKLEWGQLAHGTKLGLVEPVFPRADKSVIERMQQMESQPKAAETEKKEAAPAATSPAPATVPAQPATTAAGDSRISIEDFAKVELRVGEIKVAEKVKGADKLLRLEVDIGTEVRQVVAGIAEAYKPETLVGRKVVIVVNLQPRKLRGLESNGMIVAASVGEKGTPVLCGFLEDVPVGAKLK